MAMTVDDGGYKSRKWLGYLITSGLILLSGILSKWVIPQEALIEVITGLIIVYGTYSGVNGFRDWVSMRSGAKVTPTTDTAVKKVDPKKAVDPKKPAEEEEEGS